MSIDTRRVFFSKVISCCAILVTAGGARPKLDSLSLNRRGRCQACGSTKLWWADHNDACKRGGFIVVQRPDGASVKLDMCAECYTVRVVDHKSGPPAELVT